jgi:hypothetical protein
MYKLTVQASSLQGGDFPVAPTPGLESPANRQAGKPPQICLARNRTSSIPEFTFRGCHPFCVGLVDDLDDLDLLALASFSAMRALTIFFTSDSGRGLSAGKWMVPLEVS